VRRGTLPDPADERRAELTRPTSGQIVLHIGEGIASAIPGLGGPLAKTLAFARESREHRVVDLVIELDDRLTALGERLDAPFVESPDYTQRWEATMEEALRARQLGKREYYLRALTVIGTKARPQLDEWDFNVDTLNRIEMPGLRVLAAAASADVGVLGDTTAQWAYLREHVNEMDEVTLARCWDDLANLGLFSMRIVLVADVHAGPSDPEGLLTEYGRRFVKFLGLAVREH
jgi:hypothetical protein